MPLEVEHVTEDTPSCRSIVLTGSTGVGKTYQARKLMEAGHRVLYVSTESKRSSLDGCEFDLYTIDDYRFPRDADEKHQILAGGGNSFIHLLDVLRKEKHEWDVVYVDSLYRYSERLIDHLKNTTFNSDGGKDTRRAYGLLGDVLSTFMHTLTQVREERHTIKPVHLIGTWMTHKGVNEDGLTQHVPIIPGKQTTPNKVFGHFEDVLHLQVQQQGDDRLYVAHTKGTAAFEAKVSCGRPGVMDKLPATIGDFNLARYLEVVCGKAA